MNSDANCPKHLDVAHYVISRADLGRGPMSAQAIHAAGESIFAGVPRNPDGSVTIMPILPGTIAVSLEVPNEDALRAVAARLAEAGIAHHVVEECDGEWMSIGLRPTTDRDAVKKVLSQLRLVK